MATDTENKSADTQDNANVKNGQPKPSSPLASLFIGSAIGLTIAMAVVPRIVHGIVVGGSEISMHIPHDIHTRAVAGRLDQKDVCSLAHTWAIMMNLHLEEIAKTDEYSRIMLYPILDEELCEQTLKVTTRSKAKDAQAAAERNAAPAPGQ